MLEVVIKTAAFHTEDALKKGYFFYGDIFKLSYKFSALQIKNLPKNRMICCIVFFKESVLFS